MYDRFVVPVISFLRGLWYHDCRLCDTPHRRWFCDTIHLGTGDDIEKVKICRGCSDILAKIKDKTESLKIYTPGNTDAT